MYSRFLNHIIYPLWQQIQGNEDMLRQLQWLEQTQWLPTEEIKRIQWRKLKDLLQYSSVNVPYYSKMFSEMALDVGDIKTAGDFKRLPQLSKDDIRANLEDLISTEYREGDLLPNSTGGSTGVNLNFFADKERRLTTVAAIGWRGDRWAGLEVGEKSAYLWGAPFDISIHNKLRGRINNLVMRNLFLSSYELSEATMHLYAARLAKYRPKVIVAYPSPLYLFAEFLLKEKIKDIGPQSIICSAETLYDFQRHLIESVFHCPVFNRYGCREFGAIAVECGQHDGLHINAEHVYVECVKENDEPATPGEVGELIITDLDNYGMPFIRYKIGDMAVPSDRKCHCGRGLPLLERIEGRTFDVIVGTNGRYLGGTFWTLLLRTFVKGIKQFQVIQETEDLINITLVVDKLFQAEHGDLIKNKVREYCGEAMRIQFNIVDKIPPSESGKFRFVISKVRQKQGRNTANG